MFYIADVLYQGAQNMIINNISQEENQTKYIALPSHYENIKNVSQLHLHSLGALHQEMRLGTGRVFNYLAFMCMNNKKVFVSQSHIGRVVGLSRKQVNRIIQKLIRLQLIFVISTPLKTSQYYLSDWVLQEHIRWILSRYFSGLRTPKENKHYTKFPDRDAWTKHKVYSKQWYIRKLLKPFVYTGKKFHKNKYEYEPLVVDYYERVNQAKPRVMTS